jgi:hypothetical protein
MYLSIGQIIYSKIYRPNNTIIIRIDVKHLMKPDRFSQQIIGI